MSCETRAGPDLGAPGQALFESVWIILLIPIFLAAILIFYEFFSIRQHLLMAARHAAFLYSSRRLEWEDVEREVRSALRQDSSLIEEDKVRIEHGRHRGTPGSSAFYLMEVRVIYEGWRPLGRASIRLEERCVIHATRGAIPGFDRVYY